MAIKDLQAKIAVLSGESQILAAKADLSDADLTRIEEISAEGTRLQREYDALKKMGDFGEWAGKSAGMLNLTGAQPNGVTIHGMKADGEVVLERRDSVLEDSEGEGVLGLKMTQLLRSRDYRDAYRTMVRKGLGHVRGDAMKTLQEGLDDQGGYLAPEDIQNRVIMKKPAPTSLLGRVQRFTTSRDTVLIPKVVYATDDKYTTGMRVTWGPENPAATDHRVTDPVFGQFRVGIYTAMMSIPISNNLLEDASFDVMGFCSDKFNETIVLLKENMAINGTGSGQPRGMLANPDATDEPAHVHSGVADALSWEGMQNTAWALPPQYMGAAAWCFNTASTGLALSKLVDGNGRPLWTQGAQDTGMVGSPMQQRLLGFPVVYSQFMPDIAASAYPILFGDFAGYVVVDRVGFSLQVLRERYAEENQTVLLGKVRFGGGVAESWRIKAQYVAA